MDVTVSLPDEMRQRAKEENLKLSRILRDALTAEFARRDAMNQAMTEALKKPTTYEVDVEVDEYPVIGRITGTLIGDSNDSENSSGWQVYLTTDRRVLVVGSGLWQELKDPERDLYDLLIGDHGEQNRDIELYVKACKALGIRPVIDL